MKVNLRKRKNKLILSVSIIMAIIIAIAATYSWFTSSDFVSNRLQTGQITDGSVQLAEVFEPPLTWLPGQNITKQVSVVNHGDASVIVRVSFEEVLKKLGNAGKQTDAASPDIVGGKIPVNVVVSGYTAANGWQSITDLGLTATGVPNDVTVLGRKAVENGRTSYGFVIFYPTTYDSKSIHQKVTADFKVTNTALTVSNVKYYFFDAKTETQKDWAGENVKVGKAPYTVGPIAVTPPSLSDIKHLTADSNIKLNFANLAEDVMTDGKWWYNSTDGYFYYMGKLGAGQETPKLLSSLLLAGEVDNTDPYALMDLDLIVTMEAIQNTSDALKDAWGLDNTISGSIGEFMFTKGYCIY